MRHAYLYYRIDPAQETIAAQRIDALLESMTRHCGLPPRRLRRCDQPAVWMEVYEGIADYAAFTTALDTAVLSLDCEAFILGERHLECFSPTWF
ncbi:MAG: DUF4936 family protein [Hyphomicrobiaceae bacterium]